MTMGDGFEAAYRRASESRESDAGRILYQAGKAMAVAVPSTMGTLMASGWMQAGMQLKGKLSLEPEDIYTIFKAFEEGVAARGKAKVGDKTFLDGLDPAVKEMELSVRAGDPLDIMAQKAYRAAKRGFQDTTAMLAVHGRAAARGEASRTLSDPGAAVAVLMMKSLEETIESDRKRTVV